MSTLGAIQPAVTGPVELQRDAGFACAIVRPSPSRNALAWFGVQPPVASGTVYPSGTGTWSWYVYVAQRPGPQMPFV